MDTITQNRIDGMGNPYQVKIPNVTPITPASTLGTTPLNVPTPSNTAFIDADGAVKALATGLQNIANESTKTENAALSDVSILQNQLRTQTADTNALSESAGLPVMNKELSDLQALQTQQLGSYLSKYNNLQAGGTGTVGGVSSAETALQRKNAIDSLLTSSLIQAKQGNINAATDSVNKAIAAKYEPIKQRIENAKFILDQVKTKAATDRSNALSAQLKKVEKEEKNEEQSNKYLVTAIQGDAPASLIQKAQEMIKNGASASNVATALGKYSLSLEDRLDRDLKNLQIEKEGLSIRKARNDLNGTDDSLDKLLTISEAKDAGVPYGTTKRQLIAKGTTGTNNIVTNTLFNDRIAETNKMLGLKTGEIIVQDADGVYKVKDVNGNLKDISGGKGLAGTTGPNALSRASADFDVFTGVRSNFIASVNQLTNRATIDNLIAVKKAGGTFGALSEKELALLEQSASKIGTWAKHKNDDPAKPVIGYRVTEKELKQELAKLQSHIRAFQEADTGSRYTPEEEIQQADEYITDVGSVLQGDIYGNYE